MKRIGCGYSVGFLDKLRKPTEIVRKKKFESQTPQIWSRVVKNQVRPSILQTHILLQDDPVEPCRIPCMCQTILRMEVLQRGSSWIWGKSIPEIRYFNEEYHNNINLNQK